MLQSTDEFLLEYDRLGMPTPRSPYAHLTYDMGQPERAVRFAAASMHTRRITGISAWPAGERNRMRWLAEARVTLGDAGYAAAWDLGEAMTQEEIIASTEADLSET